MNKYAFFGAAALCAVAAPAAAQTMAPADYVAAAGASDLYERTSSQIVLGSTNDPKVRSFARMMISHHTKSTADVKAAARRAKVPVGPPELTPAQADMVAQLNAQTGPARDATYISQQRTAHDQALALHKSYAMDGTAAPLKQAAKKIVPVVEHHIMMLQSM